MMKQRLVQYDILKGIGILLVITCHAGLGGFAKLFIYTFHMPLFFFASGCFFKDYPFAEFLKKNIKQLIIPYFLFLFCMIVVRNMDCLTIKQFVHSLAVTLVSLHPLDETDRFLFESIWFLICLFNVRIIYWIINKCSKDKWKTILGVCLFLYIVGYILQRTGINIPLFIDSAFTSVIFFAVGNFFHNHKYDTKIIRLWIPFLSIFLCFAACLYLAPKTELKDNIFPCYLIVISTVMIISLYYLSFMIADDDNIKDSIFVKFLAKCGVSSLCILGFHNQLFLVFGHFLHIIPGVPPVVTISLMVIITVLAVFQIEKIINRYAPYLLGKF